MFQGVSSPVTSNASQARVVQMPVAEEERKDCGGRLMVNAISRLKQW